MDVFPDFDGLGGIGDLRAVIGALLTFVLIVAVLMLIVSAIVWAIAAANGNHAIASKGRTGVLVALGAAFSLSSTDVALADSFIDRALAIDPTNAWGWMRKGWSAIYAGASEDALRHFDRAEKLSPLDPFRFNVVLGRAAALRGLGELDASLDLVRAGMRANPGLTWAYRMILCDLVLAGREAEARAGARDFLRYYPHATVAYVRASWPPAVLHSNPEYVDAIGRCGLPER